MIMGALDLRIWVCIQGDCRRFLFMYINIYIYIYICLFLDGHALCMMDSCG